MKINIKSSLLSEGHPASAIASAGEGAGSVQIDSSEWQNAEN
jgi:hypothetical protein